MSSEPIKEVIQITERSFLIRIKEAVKLSPDEFQSLLDLCPTTKGHVVIYGKKMEIPRFQRLYGAAAYSFSGVTVEPEPLTNPVLIGLLNLVNEWERPGEPDGPYNGMLVNWYLDGTHHIGPHADDERDLVDGAPIYVDGAPIYSFSFGATRTFRFHMKSGGAKILDVPLEDGTMVAMCGDCQKELKHSIPLEKRCKKPRVNVTIRAFRPQQWPCRMKKSFPISRFI